MAGSGGITATTSSRDSTPENYRLMTIASLQGICRATGSKAPRAEIERWSSDALDVLVRP